MRTQLQPPQKFDPKTAKFNGSDIDNKRDNKRLATQIELIFMLMKDAKWRTLSEIETLTGAPASSASAQLRNLRKVRFGGHIINKRHRGESSLGYYEYQLIERITGRPTDYDPIVDEKGQIELF